MTIQELVGKRLLLKLESNSTFHKTGVEEFRIIEISPSGNWTKLMNQYGNKFWRPTNEILLVEELKQIESAPKEIK